MKKLVILLVIAMFAFASCATIEQNNYVKRSKANANALVKNGQITEEHASMIISDAKKVNLKKEAKKEVNKNVKKAKQMVTNKAVTTVIYLLK